MKIKNSHIAVGEGHQPRRPAVAGVPPATFIKIRQP